MEFKVGDKVRMTAERVGHHHPQTGKGGTYEGLTEESVLRVIKVDEERGEIYVEYPKYGLDHGVGHAPRWFVKVKKPTILIYAKS